MLGEDVPILSADMLEKPLLFFLLQKEEEEAGFVCLQHKGTNISRSHLSKSSTENVLSKPRCSLSLCREALSQIHITAAYCVSSF